MEGLTAWAPHLPVDYRDPRVVGWMLGAVLRGGGRDAAAVRETLVDSINGEHEIGQMGQHAVVALLNSEEPSDWEIIGKLLLAAQRQEGLRQSILEAVDEGSPGGFRYMLDLILEHDLARFSATVRAFDTWLGTNWAGGSAKVVTETIRRIAELLDDDAERTRVIDEGEPKDAYLALWVTAFHDAEEALALAPALFEAEDPERRYVAFRTLRVLDLLPDSFEPVAQRIKAGTEDDPRIQMATMGWISGLRFTSVTVDLFAATARCFEALPKKKKKLEPILWPWAEFTLDRRVVAGALKAMAVGEPERLMPFAGALDSYDCVSIVEQLAGIGSVWVSGRQKKRKRRKLTPEGRRLMLELVGDARQDVQKAAFEALEPLPVEDDEVERLLAVLHRKAAALRAGAIGRLSKLPDTRALEVIGTLLADKDAKKQSAGLELAMHLVETDRSAKAAREMVGKHREKLTGKDQVETVGRLLGGEVETVVLDDCLGLVPQGSRTKLPTPKHVGVKLETSAAKACLKSLAELFLEHGEEEIECQGEHGARQRVLLASAGWSFPSPKRGVDATADAQERLPLLDTWLAWLEKRPAACRDADGLELVRTWAWVARGRGYKSLLPGPFGKKHAWELLQAFETLVKWVLLLADPTGGGELLVQVYEDSLAREPKRSALEKNRRGETYQAAPRPIPQRRGLVRQYEVLRGDDLPGPSRVRVALLDMLALERLVKDCTGGPEVEHFVAAFDAGELTEVDFAWMLLHPRPRQGNWGPKFGFGPIRQVTGLREPKELEGRPALLEMARRVRDRLVEVELTRGERLNAASLPADHLRHSGGAEVLFRLIAALGRDKIVRQHEWGEPTRAYSFSRLISVTAPGEEDTPKRFGELYADSGLKPARLLEFAMFAPQWAAHVEHALGRKGLEEVVWWIHAHTKQNAYWRDKAFRELWASRIAERTELEAEDLEEGAVDVAWFNRVVKIVGADGWDELQKPARYASDSGGHKRAQLFADSMLGRVTVEELLVRVDEKRHQDPVRALGLVPLPKRKKEREQETLRRYERMQAYRRESRKFGSQRQASEGRAMEIGMVNLARTAGYRDPRRLQWAMEAEAVADLARGPVEVRAEETCVSLAIDEEGGPELTVVKKGKKLKNVPAKLRKHEPIAELRSRVTELRRQRARMRLSLEESMCRADTFTGPELRGFCAHPMLRPMIERLVFVGTDELIGYPAEGGKALRDHGGKLEPIGRTDRLRLAHPVDLLARGDWSAWQRECFHVERVQPFRQIFREVYPKTETELGGCDLSRRYAGHQVNPRQALALLKARQWISAPEEGVRKVFHDEGLIAELWFQESFYTPADVEDLTLEGVAFVKRAKPAKWLVLEEIPDLLFSEAMRDLDLVVSVAHSGGVDPEASASTVEMRATLLDETCRLLGLKNVRVDGHHAKIEGSRAEYSVHLGSATTKVLPGRVLMIVAVHSQYRGRLFLPFADDDPKTAEVLAKTLLLARDEEIKDPRILRQIRH